jgi:eukaryotic-like serine/threonine-protein kinase
MGKPRTLTDAVGLVRQSRLLSADALGGVAARLSAGDLRGLTPDALFGRLAGDGLLTPFQARQLAAGRWRGLVLRNYKLLARLGAGGMGQVFLGEHLGLGRRVAVKVLAHDLADSPTARARLVREARAAAALNHPNIVRVIDIDADATPPFLVMEFVDGVSLQAAVAVAGTFRAEAAVLVARQVADGLQHAWENGLVHRDVKPANLLLDRSGGVRILDLGIVRADFDDELTAAAGLDNRILGTVDYLAPEQAVDSSAVDCRADVYGLGATLYFLLAGHPPFADGPPAARLRLKQKADPEPIHALRPDVPHGLSAVIAGMMARRPEDRFPTPAAAAAALAPFAVPAAGFPEDVFAAAAGEVRHSRFDMAGLPSWGSTDSAPTPVPPHRSGPRLLAIPDSPTVATHAHTPRATARRPVSRPAGRRAKSVPRGRQQGNPLLWASLALAALSVLLLALVCLVVYGS